MSSNTSSSHKAVLLERLLSKLQELNKNSVELQLLKRALLKVTTDINALVDVLSWFDQFQIPPIPYDVWLQCQLALAEGFTNAVRHAHYNKPPETPVDLEIQIHSGRLEIRIWDSGPGFDLDHYFDHRPVKADTTAEGGRGLGLIRQIADDLSYTRTNDQRNCLFIGKNFAGSSKA